MASARVTDQNGFITIKDNPLSMVGVYEYLGREIDAPEPLKAYKVFRSSEMLSSQVVIDVFKCKPFINDHEMIIVKSDIKYIDENEETDPTIHGVIGENVYFDAKGKQGAGLYGNVTLFTNKIKGLIDGGKVDLSCGYWSEYHPIKGTWNGQEYDYIQIINGANHIALVDDGRMGKQVAVLDSKILLTFDARSIMNDKKNNKEKDNDFLETEDEESTEHEAIEMHTLKGLADKIDSLTAIVTALQGSATETMDEEPEEEDDDKEKDKPTMDTATVLKTVNDELSKKTEMLALADKASIGTFDHSAMLSADMAVYMANKLGLKGEPETAVRSYVAGIIKNQGASVIATTDSKTVNNNYSECE
jgi:uncharacterized protein